MNVRFPEAQNDIAALDQIGVALSITPYVYFLNGTEGSINGGVAMPEITIPLHDDSVVRNQCVYNELSADDLLLDIGAAKSLKYGMPSGLKGIKTITGGESQDPIDALHIRMIVAMLMAAVFRRPPAHSPARGIKRFVTSFATQYLTATAFLNRALMASLFRLWRILPCVSTPNRTKTDISAAARDKHLAAPSASIRTAGIAPFLEIGCWAKRLSAFFTSSLASYVVHDRIIPWMVGFVKWN